MSTYRIAEVAQQTGFTPATLRYYEDIGLMAPAGRTPAGYRVYDDVSVDRLRFIARAKQLGCSLEEITDLATAWDGGECGPVQERLQSAVDAKIAQTQGRIAELTAFTAELQQAAAALAQHRPQGPCDDTCGCATAIEPTTTPAPVQLMAKVNATAVEPTTTPESVQLMAKGNATTPAADDVPVACTLGAGEMTGRLADWENLLAAVTARRALDDGVRLELGDHADVGDIARLAAAEQDCCRFFSFAIVLDDRGVALEVHAPPDATDVVTALFGAPA